jgi:hypothetical protein
MSALIFFTDIGQALVVTDTLATKPDGSAMLFTSKSLYLPHLRLIIAGTGIGGFSTAWLMHVNDRMLVRGIDHLDAHAPESLQQLWSDYSAQYSLSGDTTTTIYHFGFSEESGNMTAFAYRSTSGFASESLPHGTAVKPECSVLPQGNLFDSIAEMLEDQRRIQSAKPAEERVYTGGEAFAIHLTEAGCAITRLYEFPDRIRQVTEAFQAYAQKT